MPKYTYRKAREARIADLKRRVEFSKSEIAIFEKEIAELEEENRTEE